MDNLRYTYTSVNNLKKNSDTRIYTSDISTFVNRLNTPQTCILLLID